MPSNPVRFLRKLANGLLQEAGNRVQLEDGTGTELGTVANPLHITPGGGSGNDDLGRVYGQLITKNFTFDRPANVNAYHAKDAINVDLAVTNASNASPIVITTGAINHLLNDGDYVTITGVTGNTNANGSYYVKRTGYSAVTFALYTDKALATPRAGNAGYINGGAVARLFRLKGILRVAGGTGFIRKVRVVTNLSTFLDPIRMHFYNAPIAVAVDHAAYTMLYANRAVRLGYVDLETLHTEGAGSDASYSLTNPGNSSGNNFPLEVYNAETPVDTDIWCRLETNGTGTPASGQSFFIEVTVDTN